MQLEASYGPLRYTYEPSSLFIWVKSHLVPNVYIGI